MEPSGSVLNALPSELSKPMPPPAVPSPAPLAAATVEGTPAGAPIVAGNNPPAAGAAPAAVGALPAALDAAAPPNTPRSDNAPYPAAPARPYGAYCAMRSRIPCGAGVAY